MRRIWKGIFIEESTGVKFSKLIAIDGKSVYIKPYGEFFSLDQAFGMLEEFGYHLEKLFDENGRDKSKIFIESATLDVI